MTQQDLGQELIRIGTAMRLGTCQWPEPGSPVQLMLLAAVEQAGRLPPEKRHTRMIECEVTYQAEGSLRTSAYGHMTLTIQFPVQ